MGIRWSEGRSPVSVYCLDWLSSSVSSMGVEGLGLVMWSRTFSTSSGVMAISLQLLLLVTLAEMIMLKGVAGRG